MNFVCLFLENTNLVAWKYKLANYVSSEARKNHKGRWFVSWCYLQQMGEKKGNSHSLLEKSACEVPQTILNNSECSHVDEAHCCDTSWSLRVLIGWHSKVTSSEQGWKPTLIKQLLYRSDVLIQHPTELVSLACTLPILEGWYSVPNTHSCKMRIVWQVNMHTEVRNKGQTRHRFTTVISETRSHTKSADALRAPVNLQDTAGWFPKHFHFSFGNCWFHSRVRKCPTIPTPEVTKQLQLCKKSAKPNHKKNRPRTEDLWGLSCCWTDNSLSPSVLTIFGDKYKAAHKYTQQTRRILLDFFVLI